MKKKVLAVFCAGALLLGCAACTQETTPESPESAEYTGSANGIGGEVSVTLTVSEGKITNVAVDTSHETAGYGLEIGDTLAQQIIDAQGADIDGVSGATVTSNAAKDATLQAMQAAGLAEAAQNISFTPGTYEGTAMGRIGEIVVDVTVSADKIEAVTVREHQESPTVSDLALSQIPADIVTYQSLGVDGVSGATMTSYGILNAASQALEKAGGNLSALRAVPVEKPAPAPVEDLHTQIVIAGGGMSGLMAAATAADQGAEVILVEKLPFIGGSLAVAGGGMVTVGSKLIPDEYEQDMEKTINFARKTYANSDRQPDYDFMRAILAETGPTMDYLIGHFDFPPRYAVRPDYLSLMFGTDEENHYGSYAANHLCQIAQENGASVLLNTRAEEILMDGDKAVGLKVRAEGGEFNIYADKVIIATGGASWNEEWMLEGQPELATVAIHEEASVGNTGDGFTMLSEIGAKVDAPIVKTGSPALSEAFHYTWRNSPGIANTLLVDAEGQRFANESPAIASHMLSWDMLKYESPAYYSFFDTVNTDEGLLADFAEQAKAENPDVVVYGETIEELAGKLGMDSAALKATFDRYQELCQAGEDSDFGKDVSHMISYAEEGGYYAVRVYPGSWGTIGGCITDTQFHALREDGSIIENVFAVGESATSTLFGDYYLGSWSLGYYSTAGRIAAETAIAEINEAE